MRVWSFYDAQTGLFSSRNASGPDDWTPVVPKGYVPLEGEFDRLSQRVDLKSGQVVDYQPPQPGSDHEWNAETKRWVITASAAERRTRAIAARVRISELETAQARALREHALGRDGAAKRLTDIDQQIQALRADL